MDIAFNFTFKEFRGCPLSLLEQLEENITKSKESLLRGVTDQSVFTLSLSQYNEHSFIIHIIINNQTDNSEDVVIGQMESNILSLQRKGILSLGLHEWELSITPS